MGRLESGRSGFTSRSLGEGLGVSTCKKGLLSTKKIALIL